jgi:hypothetical protein
MWLVKELVVDVSPVGQYTTLAEYGVGSTELDFESKYPLRHQG